MGAPNVQVEIKFACSVNGPKAKILTLAAICKMHSQMERLDCSKSEPKRSQQMITITPAMRANAAIIRPSKKIFAFEEECHLGDILEIPPLMKTIEELSRSQIVLSAKDLPVFDESNEKDALRNIRRYRLVVKK